jgi:hypothetical protein
MVISNHYNSHHTARLEAFGNVLAAQAQLRRASAKDAALSAEAAVALYKDAGDRPGEGRKGEKKATRLGKKPEKMGDLWILWVFKHEQR